MNTLSNLKTQALGLEAIRAGLSVYYRSIFDLVRDLRAEVSLFVEPFRLPHILTLFILTSAVVHFQVTGDTPGATAVLKKPDDISSRERSKVSLMPSGLLDTLHEKEVLDLIAYLESMGDEPHPIFNQ